MQSTYKMMFGKNWSKLVCRDLNVPMKYLGFLYLNYSRNFSQKNIQVDIKISHEKQANIELRLFSCKLHNGKHAL